MPLTLQNRIAYFWTYKTRTIVCLSYSCTMYFVYCATRRPILQSRKPRFGVNYPPELFISLWDYYLTDRKKHVCCVIGASLNRHSAKNLLGRPTTYFAGMALMPDSVIEENYEKPGSSTAARPSFHSSLPTLPTFDKSSRARSLCTHL